MLCQLFSNSITSPRPQGLCLLCSLLEMGLQCIFCWKKECTNKNTPGSLASRGFRLYWLKLSQSIWLVSCRLTSGLLSSTWTITFWNFLFICYEWKAIGGRPLLSIKASCTALLFLNLLQPSNLTLPNSGITDMRHCAWPRRISLEKCRGEFRRLMANVMAADVALSLDSSEK